MNASGKRSFVKSFTYRAVIVCLDFGVIYILTGKLQTAAGFTFASNLCATVGYFLHERIWARVKWGLNT